MKKRALEAETKKTKITHIQMKKLTPTWIQTVKLTFLKWKNNWTPVTKTRKLTVKTPLITKMPLSS